MATDTNSTPPACDGWNMTPGSTAELFADGLALVLLAAAFAFPQRAVRIEVGNG